MKARIKARKKGTNLTLSNEALKQARAIRTATKRGSITNVVEFLLDHASKPQPVAN